MVCSIWYVVYGMEYMVYGIRKHGVSMVSMLGTAMILGI